MPDADPLQSLLNLSLKLWYRYGLLLWAACTVAAWVLLPTEGLRALTPWVAAALLLGVALNLALSVRTLRTRELSDDSARMVRSVTLIVGVTAAAGVGFGAWVGVLLESHAGATICRVIWSLASAGFVLSLFVARLLFRLAAQLPERQPETMLEQELTRSA